jgi:hypothetical protein
MLPSTSGLGRQPFKLMWRSHREFESLWQHKHWIGCIWASFLDERTHKSLLSELGYRDIAIVLLVF